MATSYLTQLIQLALDAAFVEDGQSGVVNVPVYGPSYDVYKFEPIEDPGMKGRARTDATRYGAGWAEFPFYVELGGFTTYDDGGALYEPPFWGVLCQALGMKKLGFVGGATGSFEVVDTIHLSDDTVHTSEHLTALDCMVNIDGYKYILKNAIGNGTFSLDVNEGPPRLTFDNFKGNIFDDVAGNFYNYPIKDFPLDFTEQLGGSDECDNAAPSATICLTVAATFVTDGVAAGDIAFNVTTGEQAIVVTVDGETQITTTSITDSWTDPDVVKVYRAPQAFEAPIAADAKNITVGITTRTAAGETVVITDTDFRRWTHNLGNNVVEQRDGEQDFKLGQFLVADQNANAATLVIRVLDPGTQATPGGFNPHLMVAQRDMFQLTLTHNPGATLGQIIFRCDYYISDVVGVIDDGNGVLEYNLALRQANLIPAGTAAQYLKLSLS